MILSYNWLKEFVKISLSPPELAEKLNLSGLPVEEIKVKGDKILGVIVGKILKIEKHPNADKLSYCDVTDGSKIYKIVCGAQNIKEGMTVPLATIGAVLPGDFKIKKSKIRGIESEGMMCSAKELGIADDHSGILSLDPDKYRLGDIFSPDSQDVLFSVEITPNRPDLLCVMGAARFIASITGEKIKEPDYSISNQKIDNSLDINKMLKVELKESSLCPRYCARIIQGVKVADSPEWLKEKLINMGVRPINNVVDITNYILFELNQPLHAFDYKKIKGSKIIIRKASDGEKITALDGKEYSLKSSDLVISDSSSPIAIAGVMGGEHFSVSQDTTDIVLESAYFNPGTIRKTSRSLGISSDSSYRFERGIDIHNTVNAMNRAAAMIAEICGGNISFNIIDEYPNPSSFISIKLRPERINQILGTNFTKAELYKILDSSSFSYSEANGIFEITVPGYRNDILQEIDLIEEIAQIAGYDKIPSTLPCCEITMGAEPTADTFIRKISDIFISYGFSQAYNYSFLNTKLLKSIGASSYIPEKPAILRNPFNEEETIMKTTLIPDLIKNLIHNINNEEYNVHLFESANIFSMPEKGKFLQSPVIGCITHGAILPQTFNKKELKTDLFFTKSLINNILKTSDPRAKIEYIPANIYPVFLEYGFEVIINGKKTGYGGQLKEEILYLNKIKDKAYVFELDINTLLSISSNVKLKYTKISPYPSVKRDLSILIDSSIPAISVENKIKEASQDLIYSITLFDMYKGPQVPSGKKSLSYNLLFRSSERTLSESEVNKTMDKIITTLGKELNAELRS